MSGMGVGRRSAEGAEEQQRPPEDRDEHAQPGRGDHAQPGRGDHAQPARAGTKPIGTTPDSTATVHDENTASWGSHLAAGTKPIDTTPDVSATIHDENTASHLAAGTKPIGTTPDVSATVHDENTASSCSHLAAGTKPIGTTPDGTVAGTIAAKSRTKILEPMGTGDAGMPVMRMSALTRPPAMRLDAPLVHEPRAEPAVKPERPFEEVHRMQRVQALRQKDLEDAHGWLRTIALGGVLVLSVIAIIVAFLLAN